MPTDRQESVSLLKDVAYEHIKELILKGELVPGDRLSERKFGAMLNMSKTPIKAALERLEEQGFVTLSPRRSAEVKGLTKKEIADIYDFRIALESFIVGELTGRLDDVTKSALDENLRLQRRLTTTGALDDWPQADYVFHLTLSKALGNDQITRTMTRIRDQVRWLIVKIAQIDASIPAISCLEHQEIVEHMIDGNRDHAIEAVTRHLRNGRRFIAEGKSYSAE